jgi:septum formation protein
LKIILASKSPFRRELFKRLHLTFEVMDSQYDESLLKNQSLSALELSQALSREKAYACLNLLNSLTTDVLIIASDQVAVTLPDSASDREKILSKPGNFETAHAQLSLLQGKSHFLHTSVYLLKANSFKEVIKERPFTNSTELEMRPLTSDEITRYLHLDQPYGSAGSYMLEKSGIALMKKLSTTDETAIVGLPLIELQTVLLEDFSVTFLSGPLKETNITTKCTTTKG